MTSCRLDSLFHFLFLFCFLSYSTAVDQAKPEPAGIKIRITNTGLDKLREEVQVKFLNEELKKITVAKFSMPVPLTASLLNLEFENVEITSLNLNNSHLSLERDRLSLKVQDGAITITATEHSFGCKLLHSGGRLTVSADSVEVVMDAEIARDNAGQPSLKKSLTCDAKIPNAHITFHNEDGKLIQCKNLLAAGTLAIFNTFLQNLLCKVVKETGLARVNAILKDIPVDVEIYERVRMDTGLVADPRTSNMGLDMDFKGVFYYVGENAPEITQSERMIYVAVNSHCINTGLSAAYAANLLHATIPEDMVPKDAEHILKLIKKVNRALTWTQRDLSFAVAAEAVPTVTIKDSGITVHAPITVTINVKKERHEPLIMTFDTTVKAEPYIEGTKLSLRLNNDSFSFKGKSNSKVLDLTRAWRIVGRKLRKDMLPLINNQGFQIPVPVWMNLNPAIEIVYHDGYVLIGADLDVSNTEALNEALKKAMPDLRDLVIKL